MQDVKEPSVQRSGIYWPARICRIHKGMPGLRTVWRLALSASIVTSTTVAIAQQNTNLPQAIADAIAARRLSENSALFLDRNLDQQDVGLLSDQELISTPVEVDAQDRSLEKTPSGSFAATVADSAGSPARYRYGIKASSVQSRPLMQDLQTDRSLSPPVIKVDLADPMYPTVSIPKLKGRDGREALYYFEFDTSPS